MVQFLQDAAAQAVAGVVVALSVDRVDRRLQFAPVGAANFYRGRELEMQISGELSRRAGGVTSTPCPFFVSTGGSVGKGRCKATDPTFLRRA